MVRWVISGDSWKVNSGITKCEYDDEFWYFYGYSGSVYKCHMEDEKMSGYTESIFDSFKRQVAELNNGSTIEVIQSYGGHG